MTRRPWLSTDPNTLFTAPTTLDTGTCPRDPKGIIRAGTAIGETGGQHVAFDETNPAHTFTGLLWEDVEGDGPQSARIYTGNGIARARVNSNYLPVKTGPGSLANPQIKAWINANRFHIN